MHVWSVALSLKKVSQLYLQQHGRHVSQSLGGSVLHTCLGLGGRGAHLYPYQKNMTRK